MLQFEELRLKLLGYEDKLRELKEALGLDELKAEQARLEEMTAQEDFWGDLANSQKVLQKIASLKNKIKAYDDLKASFDDGLMMIELSDEEEDESMIEECSKNVDSFTVTKTGAASDEEINAISGATITSKAVTNTINKAIAYARAQWGGEVVE